MSDWGSSSCGPHTFYFSITHTFYLLLFLLFSFCHYEHNMARRFWSWPQNRFLMRLVTERALLGWLRPPISHHTLPLLENLSCLFFSISLSCSLMGLNRRENSSNLLPQSDENYTNGSGPDDKPATVMMRRRYQGVVSHAFHAFQLYQRAATAPMHHGAPGFQHDFI